MSREHDPLSNPEPDMFARTAAVWREWGRLSSEGVSLVELTVPELQDKGIELPRGAKLCTDEETNLTLKELHLEQVKSYRDPASKNKGRIDDYEQLLNDAGYDFRLSFPGYDDSDLVYRWHWVHLSSGSVHIIEPWIDPKTGGGPFPLLFLYDDPFIQEVRVLAYKLRDAAKARCGGGK